jgi:hypothetical protein
MRRVRLSVVPAILIFGLAGSAEAQTPMPWYLEGFVSYSAINGGLGDVAKSGVGLGAVVGYVLPSHLWIMGSFSTSWNPGEGSLTDWQTYAYMAQVGYDLTKGQGIGSAVLFAGGGGVTLNPKSDLLESSTNFGLTGGFKLVLRLANQVYVPINLAAALVFSGEGETSDTWLFPLTVGLAVKF